MFCRAKWKMRLQFLCCLVLTFTSVSCKLFDNDAESSVKNVCGNFWKSFPQPNYDSKRKNIKKWNLKLELFNNRCTKIICLRTVKFFDGVIPKLPKTKICAEICHEYTNFCEIPGVGQEFFQEELSSCDSSGERSCLSLSADGVPYIKKVVVEQDPNPEKFAPLETELGEADRNEYRVEVIAVGDKKVPGRRYDIVDLGDGNLFQGWVDVQGNGAANDYCRVVGKGKRRFLSCALAGSTGQDHHYVSRQGFDIGYPDTWFMRDADDDGRDDYCRCVGNNNDTRISCMKAGRDGFYSSILQKGSQFSFDIPGTNNCKHRKLNPFFGA